MDFLHMTRSQEVDSPLQAQLLKEVIMTCMVYFLIVAGIPCSRQETWKERRKKDICQLSLKKLSQQLHPPAYV